MQNKKYKFLLGILILILIAINYSSLDTFITKNFSNEEFVEVERVIDGDTVVINGTSIRLLGMNAPEKGEKYYAEAKNYTGDLVANKTLRIEKKGKDLYGRELAYLFYGNENLNSKIVEKGYANYYFPSGKDNYYNLLLNSWKNCLENNLNLCEKSLDKCAKCIVSEQFGYNKNLILYNSCDFDCNLNGWSVKDEGRKKFIFENFTLKSGKEIEITSEDFGKDYVWTRTGDTMFLRDSDGKLVIWGRY